MDSTGTTIGILQILLGLSLFTGSIVLLLRKWMRIKKSARTIGIVVNSETMMGMRHTDSSPRSTLYSPTVRFQTADGRVIDYTQKIYDNVSNYRIGENVPVYYNPHQPEEAIVGTAFRLWYRLSVFGLVGGGFVLIGTFFVFFKQIVEMIFKVILR
ncbi:MAG TPA: DUF3592 domain-containing protein [Pyrinomonadaceae bacterium]|jgi:hypothetical protein